MELAERLVEHPAEHLRVPEVEPREAGEDRRPDQHLMEVGDHEVGVVGSEVDRAARRASRPSRHPSRRRTRNPMREQHRGLEFDLPSPHRPDPVEEFDPGRNCDQQGKQREEREENGAGGEHVVRPDTGREGRDRHRREDHALVAEQRLSENAGMTSVTIPK